MQLYVMREIPTWDQYYLDICKVVATRSKDPNTQIGCVIIGPNHEIRSTGYNSFPRGIRDDVPERLVRPTKYLWIEHAERNAICNAARAGTATEGCTIYVEIMPCMDCARAVVQAGIVQVVYRPRAWRSTPANITTSTSAWSKYCSAKPRSKSAAYRLCFTVRRRPLRPGCTLCC